MSAAYASRRVTGLQVHQPLVRRREPGLEQVRGVVGDHAHRQAQEPVRGPHPLGVASGEVVVDRDDVGAAPAEAVEHRGQGRDEGLALARPHLGDLALVERDGAHQLDVVLAHAHGPLHGLAARGEDLGDDLVHGGAQALVLALPAGLGQVAAALQVGAVELVLGRLLRLRGLEDLGADQVDPLADLLVGEGLVLGFELVRAIDERLDPAQLAVVVVEESWRGSAWPAEYRVRAREAPDSRAGGVRPSGAGRDLDAGRPVGHHDVAGERLEAGVGDARRRPRHAR